MKQKEDKLETVHANISAQMVAYFLIIRLVKLGNLQALQSAKQL